MPDLSVAALGSAVPDSALALMEVLRLSTTAAGHSSMASESSLW